MGDDDKCGGGVKLTTQLTPPSKKTNYSDAGLRSSIFISKEKPREISSLRLGNRKGTGRPQSKEL